MSIEELKKNLEYLVTKYVTDSSALAELRDRIGKIQPGEFPPAKGIMTDIHAHISEADPKDSELFREIALYYL